ncbi:M18 family aminopeptidase [Clostridium estertheticum]|uniref:Probable M18 family aminopeptidase 2 n=1 Tax=Clostridium estertheticum TaxID=238834 RepID=A0AA47EH92_9CLOT|nr:M18 family aminopeptidase [Clostridium estertheticum]MBU3154284.1 M18 family aminopeptidase [Clostridium estertheticum]MBU3197949.1 M18 family aminopeptidase [Clostridium estertheticum]WAG60178.1 M18 family aminopeptidase [Clostridium estertheticum]WAG65744.1 M18 family aminopeptidase [Clostridium estertheticum]
MNKELEFAQNLIDYIYDSPTAYHAVAKAKENLSKAGFVEIKEEDKWELKKGGKYFVTKNDSALTAFVVGKGEIEESGFKIIGAHTDSPSFRIKPSPEMVVDNVYVRLNTEVYGGPILNTWMDRPLAIAGRVTLKSDDILHPETRLVNIKRPIMIIPNLAIHMNRNVNTGIELNKQKDLLPLLSMVNENLEKNNYLISAIAKELSVDLKEIIDFDLFLYEYEKGSIIGLNNEFISSSRLDDLAMVHAGISAISTDSSVQATNVIVCFDNEEVGSSTKQGADSNMLVDILERITISLHKNRDDFFRAISKSFIISADNAHAVHPNSPEKNDPTNKPYINKGPVIKISASQSYTTDSNSDAVYELICEKASVPVQKFVNRSDARGGSTIGPISSTHLNIRSVDMGSPTLAMHSIRELGGVLDHFYVTKSFEEFYKI